jgi:hypothetical protein
VVSVAEVGEEHPPCSRVGRVRSTARGCRRGRIARCGGSIHDEQRRFAASDPGAERVRVNVKRHSDELVPVARLEAEPAEGGSTRNCAGLKQAHARPGLARVRRPHAVTQAAPASESGERSRPQPSRDRRRQRSARLGEAPPADGRGRSRGRCSGFVEAIDGWPPRSPSCRAWSTRTEARRRDIDCDPSTTESRANG